MKRKILYSMLALMVMIVALSSCLSVLSTKRSDDSESSETVAPTELTIETEDDESSSEHVIMIESDRSFHLTEVLYLQMDATARLIGEDVADSLTIQEDGPMIELPAGTILIPLNSQLPSGETLYHLWDGRCVSFTETVFSDGLVRIEADNLEYYLPEELFGPEGWQEGHPYVQENIEVYELISNSASLPWDALRAQSVVINVDWNGDGVEDTIRREEGEGHHQTIVFTEGATGEVTDITDRFSNGYESYSGYTFPKLTANAILYHDIQSNKVYIIDSYTLDGGIVITEVYFYDEHTIVDSSYILGRFAFDGEDFVVYQEDIVFGNVHWMEYPAELINGSLVFDSDSQIVWYADAHHAWTADQLPPMLSYTLQDVRVARDNNGDFEMHVIPAGTAIFPLYVDNYINHSGMVYFLLADKSLCRMTYIVEEGDYGRMTHIVEEGEYGIVIREDSLAEVYRLFGG